MIRTDIDLSPLLAPGIKFAVRCETEEEAIQFIAAVREQFPEKKTNLAVGNTRWNNDNYGLSGGTAYFPDINNIEEDMFLAGNVDYAKKYGYQLVKFSDLSQDDIKESDTDIKVLLGAIGVH